MGKPDRLAIRNKRQNEHIKANYDRISATLPKGTINRIKNQNVSINGLINQLVLEWLDENEK